MTDDLFGSTRPENLPPARSIPKRKKFVTIGKAPCIPEDDPERFIEYLKGKRTKPTDHSKRTIEYLEAQGCLAAYRVDHYTAYTGRWNDLLGFQDVQALSPDRPGVIAVQLTSKDHMTDRIKKACSLRDCITWLECGNSFLVIGWFKGSNGRWLCAETWIDLAKAKEIYDKATP